MYDKIYKVLEVREYNSILKGSFHKDYGGSGGSMAMPQRRIVVAICEDEETRERKRFEFCNGHEEIFLGEKRYFGYSGEYELLISGDRFTIKETRTYDRVDIIKN